TRPTPWRPSTSSQQRPSKATGCGTETPDEGVAGHACCWQRCAQPQFAQSRKAMTHRSRRSALLLVAACAASLLGACKADPEDPARLWTGQTGANTPAGTASTVAAGASAAAASRNTR